MLTINLHNVDQPSDEYIEAVRSRFLSDGHVIFERLLENSLCNDIVAYFHNANYLERHTENIGCVQACTDEEGNNKLNHMLSRPRVIKAINQIYGGPAVDFFMGNVVRRMPEKGHFSRFHNDAVDSLSAQIDGVTYRRAVALSLNISAHPYTGGTLTLGDRVMAGEGDTIDGVSLHNTVSVANEVPGNALLFRIAPDRFHRVEDVNSGGPRVVFVGWFYTKA